MFPQTYKNSPFKEIIYPCNVLGLSSTQPTRLIRPYFCFNKFVCSFHTNSYISLFLNLTHLHLGFYLAWF